MINIFRDRRPVSLTTWKLSNDKNPVLPESVNIGSELAGADAPKFKFMFTVFFEFGDTLRSDTDIHSGSWDLARNTYACKSVTRPNITVNYTEMNAYNYRFKVATRTDVGTVTLTLYDDNKSVSHTLLERYLKAISPIANRPSGVQYYVDDDGGMSSLGPLPSNDQSRGVLSEAGGLIKSMRVTHHYNSDYSNRGERSHCKMHYDYINPKIQSFVFDELDMSTSEPASVSITFVYDSVHMQEVCGDGGIVTMSALEDVEDE